MKITNPANSISLGKFGVVLMLIFSILRVVTPKSDGLVDGLILAISLGKSSIVSAAIVPILLIYFCAFALTFSIFKKNRAKIFYCIIFFTILKWVVDVAYAYVLLNGQFELKIWSVCAFFVGAYLTNKTFLSSETKTSDIRSA